MIRAKPSRAAATVLVLLALVVGCLAVISGQQPGAFALTVMDVIGQANPQRPREGERIVDPVQLVCVIERALALAIAFVDPAEQQYADQQIGALLLAHLQQQAPARSQARDQALH